MNLAAVCYDTGNGPGTDELLTSFAHVMRRAGLRLAGAVQTNEPRGERQRCNMTLEDLASGRRVGASQDRGPLAQGCRLDTSALEEVAGLVAASLGPEIDLVIINRFGKREAEGRGFRPVIETAVLLDVPVLIGLSEAYRDAWSTFTGLDVTYLSPTLESISHWCASVLPNPATPLRGSARILAGREERAGGN